MDDYPIKRWHYITAFLLLLATGIVPAEPELEPTDNQIWAETHYEREYEASRVAALPTALPTPY